MQISLRAATLWLALGLSSAMLSVPALAQLQSALPVTAELGTSIAREQFPVTVKLQQGALYMTDPAIQYLTSERIGISVTFQAYDHRPEDNVAISETGTALFSGRLAYEPSARKVLLHQPSIDELVFDRSTPAAEQMQRELRNSWAQQVKDPMRFDLPHHPYLIPFRQNISALDYDGQHILILLQY